MAIEVDPAGIEPHAILEAVDFRNARVLEVGSGDGRLTFRYAEQSASVVGIDTKDQDVRLAAGTLRAGLHSHVQFLCANATGLPFAAARFEIVLLASSL